MKRTIVRLFLVLVLAGLAVGLVTARSVWTRIHSPFQGHTETEQFIDIPSGSGPAAIGRRLVEAGIVRDAWTFRTALWWSGRARELKAGEYQFVGPLSAIDVVLKLVRGEVFARRLTFPEGLTIAEMAEVFETRGFGTAAQFLDAASDASAIRELDPSSRNLEGYLFPETYALPRGTPAARLVGMMVERFQAVFDERLRALAKEQGLTIREVVTLASLVEKETGQPSERPLVAGVYRNRLKVGMGLQADPTVVYALRLAGRYDGNIRRQDLALDSPYNTYRYPGLPPGPIAAPGAESLKAALMPADVDYLYFVSRNDGSHAFARTLSEHNRNVREFQVLYFRRQAGARTPGRR
ncbi:MAG: endolytic transglycosylase MltG [Acidobacteria bacterium]|nr:endolytic transglycosylase MltG [Acidobacteriota bacterium]